MKLHTNILDDSDIRHAVEYARTRVDGERLVAIDGLERSGSRSHSRAFEVCLSGNSRSTSQHYLRAAGTRAATYEEWGFVIAYLLELEPDAKFGPYDGQDDFNEKTRFEFWPAEMSS